MTHLQHAALAAAVRALQSHTDCIRALQHILPGIADPATRAAALIQIRDRSMAIRFDADQLRDLCHTLVAEATDASAPSAISVLSAPSESLIPEDSTCS